VYFLGGDVGPIAYLGGGATGRREILHDGRSPGQVFFLSDSESTPKPTLPRSPKLRLRISRKKW